LRRCARLSDGAGPINFIEDFGDTAALMLTVASPQVGEVEIALRAQALRGAIEKVRATMGAGSAHSLRRASSMPQRISLTDLLECDNRRRT